MDMELEVGSPEDGVHVAGAGLGVPPEASVGPVGLGVGGAAAPPERQARTHTMDEAEIEFALSEEEG